ncbi:helix-turn-helix transcriptional regulator [Pigmentiphaga aceris]|nr:helix-turn-helix transcriptional regulator [Pigmentiphaga aceris]
MTSNLDNAVELLFDSILDDALFEPAIAGLGQAMGNRRALLIWSTRVGKEAAEIVATHRADGADFDTFLSDYGAYYHQYDPTKFRWESMREHHWLVEDQTESRQVWASGHFYQDFALAQGIVGWAALKVGQSAPERGTHDWALTFPRDRGAKGFDAAALHAMQHVAPQLRRAFHLRRQHAELRRLANAGLEAFNLYRFPLMLTETDGRPRFCNTAAERYLAQATSCLQMKSTMMQARVAEEQPRWRSFVAAGAQALGNAAAGIRLRDGNGIPVLIQRLPLTPSLRSTSAWERPLQLMVVHEQSSLDAATSPEILRYVYGFTQAERRVARALAQDRSLLEIAEASGTKPSTVRSQIKSMLAKTGCRRQVELVRLLVMLTGFVGH